MIRKFLPPVPEAVQFINACLNSLALSRHNLVGREQHYIEFELTKRGQLPDPHGWALTRLWTCLGPQTRMLRPREVYASAYEWDFTQQRSLVLLLTREGRTIIRLFDLDAPEVVWSTEVV